MSFHTYVSLPEGIIMLPGKKHLNMNPKGDHMLNLLPFKFSIYTIWLFNIAMENHHFLTGKPIYEWAIFHGYVK